MRTIKIVTVAVAALFLFMIFQNSYSQSLAMAEAKEIKSAQPAAEALRSEEPKDLVSDSGPIQSVPGPPLMSGSVTQPRAQFAITEALLMVVAFVVLGLIAIPVVILSPILLIVFLCISPLFVIVNILFILLIMFLPVILASFADVSTYEIPGAIQRILNDIGSKGTVTEILFSYFKNLWSIVLHLPDIVMLTGDLNTEDYGDLIKRFGSFVLDYPRNIRALPNKILRNLFPTVNALPNWLRQFPVLLQVFPLLMYVLVVLPVIALIGFGLILVLGITVTLGLLPFLLIPAAIPLVLFGAILFGAIGLVLGVVGGLLVGLILGLIVLILAMLVIAAIGACIGAGIGLIIALVVGLIFAVIYPAIIIIGLILGIVVGGLIGAMIGLVIGFIALAAITTCLMVLGLIVGVVLGALGAIAGLILTIVAVVVLFVISLVLLPIILIIGVPITLILGGLLAILLLPLMLPVGPQAVKSYPAVFSLGLSLAENSISIPLGCCVGLPLAACLSVFSGLPGSLRAVLNHLIDFCATPFLFAMRALPLMGTFVVLMILWIAGAILAVVFSPFILIAPVFIVLALFVEGLKDDDLDAISTDGIKASIDNLPENVGEVDRVIKRMAEMISNAATTDISGLLDSLLDVDWLIATQNLPYVLPEAMRAVGSAVPSIIESCPDIIQAFIDSGLKLTITVFEMLSDTLVAQVRNIFALIWAMPEFALLIPQLLEILSVLTINLPVLIQGFIPAAVDAVEQTTVNLPELFPSIVLSTMGLNAIVLQFARGVWRISMRVSTIIIQTLWYLILLLPTTIFDFDEFVTPWLGSRLLSVVGACCGAIPSACIGGIASLLSLILSGCLTLGMCCYLPLQLCMTVCSFALSCCNFIAAPINICAPLILDLLGSLALIIPEIGPLVDALTTLINGIIEVLTTIITWISNIIAAISVLTDFLLPIFFLILVILTLFPLAGIVAAFIVLAFIYFLFYILQIMIGTLLMACSGVFQSVVCVPLMSLCEPVPIISTLLGYLNTLTSLYAFFIPPNFIEIITQLVPFSVNLLAACPAIVFMPISLVQTFFSTASSAVGALPSVPAYLGRLMDRIIFSFVAEILALISLAITVFVAVLLSCFAIVTGILGELLSLDILTNAPKIAVLVLALIFVLFAWIIDLCGVMCLRMPDMINEYAYSILKSMAMMPILSAIVPGMAGAPAQMQPEVVSAGLSKLMIIIILSPLAILGALATLIYNIFKEVFMWLYGTAPSLLFLPFNLVQRVLYFINNIFSGIGSTLEGAASSIESQIVPYVG